MRAGSEVYKPFIQPETAVDVKGAYGLREIALV